MERKRGREREATRRVLNKARQSQALDIIRMYKRGMVEGEEEERERDQEEERGIKEERKKVNMSKVDGEGRQLY